VGVEGLGVDEQAVTRFARAPDGVSIAYQVTGDGPLDLLLPPALSTPVDLLWDEPGFVRFARRLGRFCRIVQVDYRGVGASGGDFLDSLVQEIADADLTAVFEAAGCERVVLFGTSMGGPTAIRYATTHPERVKALVLVNTYAHYLREVDYEWGLSAEALDPYAAAATERWGTGAAVEFLAPSRSADPAFGAWWARCERLGIGVDAVGAGVRASFALDVRTLLATLAVPTLVLHRIGNRYVRVGAGRYLAERIPGAKYVELAGDDNMWWVGDSDALLDEVEEFLTGSHQAPEGDVVTATILFTDIVASTEQSARIGHRKWTALVDEHDAMVRATLGRYRGREVKTTGDGFLATFDATTRAVRAAVEIVMQAKNIGIEVRAGVHAGEVEVRPDDVVGLTVSIAKRICDLAGPAEVFASEPVKALLDGSGITTTDQGKYVLKGVPDERHLYAIEP